MFYQLDYQELGFTHDEWEEVSPGDQRLIRDWILNGYSDLRTVVYDSFSDDTRLRKLRQKYQLDERPKIQVLWTHIHLY